MPLSKTALLFCLENSYLKHSVLFSSDDEDESSLESEYEAPKSKSSDIIVKKPLKRKLTTINPVKKSIIKRRKLTVNSNTVLLKRKKLYLARARSKNKLKNGEYARLYNDYRNDPENFYEYTRMTVETFDYILQNAKKYLDMKVQSISAAEKLIVTLRYIIQREPLTVLAKSFYVGRTTVVNIIKVTLNGLWKALSSKHMPNPTQERYLKISEDFYSKFKFPNVIGTIGQKYFRVWRRETGFEEKGTKKSFLVMQGIVDANHRFIAIEVTPKVQNHDTFHHTNLNKLLASDKFNVPSSASVPDSNLRLPFVLVGDEMYPLRTYLMRPYIGRALDSEKKIFNTHVEKLKQVNKEAFNIFMNKWMNPAKPLKIHQKHANLFFKVFCLLHNVILDLNGYSDKDFQEFANATDKSKKVKGSKRNNRSCSSAMAVRDMFKSYLASKNSRARILDI